MFEIFKIEVTTLDKPYLKNLLPVESKQIYFLKIKITSGVVENIKLGVQRSDCRID